MCLIWTSSAPNTGAREADARRVQEAPDGDGSRLRPPWSGGLPHEGMTDAFLSGPR
jgi:hypothetical protein